jgi:hypothetical protein
LLTSRLDANQDKIEANQEQTIAKIIAHQVRMVARLEVKMDSWLKKGGDPPRKNGGHDKDQ